MTPADTIADFACYRELKREWEAATQAEALAAGADAARSPSP